MNVRHRFLKTCAAFALAAAGCLQAPPVAMAEGSSAAASLPAAKAADTSFARFCKVWMGKLAARERDNAKGAKARRNGSGFVMEYIGYAKKHTRCDTKATGVATNPYVGKMVYIENKLRKQGATRDKARSSTAHLVSRTEVMEIFRFDGSRWVY